MADAGLVDLARRFVELSDKLETVRGEIKRAVLNGAGDNPPFSPAPVRRPSGKAAAEAERSIVKLLREQPAMRTAELAKATGAPVVTTQDRLRRLKARGEVEGGGTSGWQVTVPA
jgi:hypothetical protein